TRRPGCTAAPGRPRAGDPRGRGRSRDPGFRHDRPPCHDPYRSKHPGGAAAREGGRVRVHGAHAHPERAGRGRRGSDGGRRRSPGRDRGRGDGAGAQSPRGERRVPGGCRDRRGDAGRPGGVRAGAPAAGGRRVVTRRGWVALIFVTCAASLGWLARREVFRSTGARLADAALSVPPGAVYYRLAVAGQQIGFASSTIDTAASTIRVEDVLVLDVPALGVLHRTTTLSRATLS